MADPAPPSQQPNDDDDDADKESNAGEATEVQEEEPPPEPEKKKEKELIPDDFYYEASELWRKPLKSDETLTDNLISLYHSFGYPCRMRHNLHALDENRLVFGAGGYLQIITHGQTSKYLFSYLPTTGGGSIGALAVHPLGTLLAVAEKGDNPVINIFDVTDFRLYRILREGTTKYFTAVAFNDSGTLLASQGGDPDYMLTVWNWKQEAILLRCKSFAQEVYHVSFNRDMQGDLTTSGSGHIKFWQMAYTFTGLKLKGAVGRFGKTALSDIEGYIEFPDGKVLSGSDWGNMLLWDERLIKVQITRKAGKPCHLGPIYHMMMVEGEIITTGADGFVRSWNWEQIDVLEAGEESGMVELDAMNEVMIGHQTSIYYLSRPPIFNQERKGVQSKMELTGRKVSREGSLGDDSCPGRNIWYAQDGTGGIWQADLSFVLAAKPPRCLLRYHAGAVVACAVSPISHLLMTLGEDGVLRLYDFLSKKTLASISFKAKGSSLTWVPVSIDRKCATVLAGFSDGGVRRVVIERRGGSDTTVGADGEKCTLTLVKAMRPHEKAVTCLAYSRTRERKGAKTFLATTSEDHTIFFFKVLSEDDYFPWCFVPLGVSPRHIHWSSEENTSDHLLLSCDQSICIEMMVPVSVDTRETLEHKTTRMRTYKFPSCKSEILHAEETAVETKRAEAEQKRKEAENKNLLESGLETPSQQNLRVDAEKANIELARREREANEPPWRPYVPLTPSNILQCTYSEPDSKFWLALSDFDAGFVYECQFTNRYKYWDVEDNTEELVENHGPVRAVRVKDAEEDPITAMCFNSDGSLVFYGLKNGKIRLQFLETEYDLGAVRSYWSVGAHDVNHGALMDMKLSHDELFLITVGADGNIFVFSLVTPEELHRELATAECVIPKGNAETPDGKPAADLAPNQYTLEQFKQKSEYDKMLALAEANKNQVRQKIGNLRVQFKKVMTQNHAMPPYHRLTKEEFVMDHSRTLEAYKENEEKVTEVRRQMAWDSEKMRLGLQKLTDYYMKGMKTDHFCVYALGSNHNIWSYRVREDMRRRSTMAFNPRGTAKKGSSFDTAGEEERKEYIEKLEAEIQGLMVNTGHLKEVNSSSQFMSQRTCNLLKKCNALRIKRARRKIQWKNFLATKPHDDYEDPADVEGIEEAKRTMGYHTLKADPSYIVPDSYKLDKENAVFRLDRCDFILAKVQADFNKSLIQLRDDKREVVKDLEAYRSRIEAIHNRLKIAKQRPLPVLPKLLPEEQPELRYSLSSEAKKRLRVEAHRVSAQWTSDFMQSVAQMSSSQGSHGVTRKPSFFSKSQRKTSYSIAKESYFNVSTEHGSEGYLVDHGGANRTRSPFNIMEDAQASPLELEIQAEEQIRLEHEQNMLLRKIKEVILEFDIKHRQLRHEKFDLDVLVKRGQLRSNTLSEEYLLLSKCHAVEQGIQERIAVCMEQKLSVDKEMKSYTLQITKLTKEFEELGKKETELFHAVSKVIGENPFRDFLLRVYKKKVKRKKVQEEGDESESESDSDSDDDDDFGDDDDEEGEAQVLDLNVCPPKCNAEIFNEVVDLRNKRSDNDESMAEVKRQRDSVYKELDTIGKKKAAAEGILAKNEKEMELFQLEKQKMVNELDVVTGLQLHQIQCLTTHNALKPLTTEVCINETEVLRLQNRIRELQQEKKDMKKAMAERRKHHIHLNHERSVFSKQLTEMEKVCNSDMEKKFGRLVDLEEVEIVPADHEVEDVRARVFKNTQECGKEMSATVHELKILQYDRIMQMRINSEFIMLEAAQKALKQELEKRLDAALKSTRMVLESPTSNLQADIRLLSDVVKEQKDVMKALKMEIQFLMRGDMPDDEEIWKLVE